MNRRTLLDLACGLLVLLVAVVLMAGSLPPEPVHPDCIMDGRALPPVLGDDC